MTHGGLEQTSNANKPALLKIIHFYLSIESISSFCKKEGKVDDYVVIIAIIC